MSTAAARKSFSGGRALFGLILAMAVLMAAPGPAVLRAAETAAVEGWRWTHTATARLIDEVRRRLGRETPSQVAIGETDAAPLSGAYAPADARAAALAGTVTFAGAEVRLETGGVLRTRPHRLVPSQESLSRTQTWAEAFDLPADVQVEVREVVSGQAPALCEGADPAWLALIQSQDAVALLPLNAGAAPGKARDEPACPLLRLERR